MKRLLIALAVIAAAAPLFGCINTYGTDLKGQPVATFFTGDDLVEYLTEPGGPNWRAQKKPSFCWSSDACARFRDNLQRQNARRRETSHAIHVQMVERLQFVGRRPRSSAICFLTWNNFRHDHGG